MPRPFRFSPPVVEGILRRERLVDRLALRFRRRLVTVVAGPGFGKTVLLGDALACPKSGRDVWLACEPADEAPDHLVRGLAGALGVRDAEGLEGILEAVWASAPEDVCLVLDDVHEIPAHSGGAEVLRRLVRDLAANGHVVLSSRRPVPVAVARLAVSGQLVRVDEQDMVFDADELDAFAARRGVDAHLLATSGGWPALAELTASAGGDLVLDYLWDEVLSHLGQRRTQWLARFGAARGGDDEVAVSVADGARSVDDVVADVPLVQRGSDDLAVLHPLWDPALRRVLSDREAAEARRCAATVHRRRGRFSSAVDLLVEAEAWDEVLVTIRAAEDALWSSEVPFEFGRWHQALPPKWRDEPEGLLAAALERKVRRPAESLPPFERAAAAFRRRGDVDGELVAISHAGVVRWWLNDTPGLLALYTRVGELAATGSEGAKHLGAIGLAALAHLQGDSATVLELLTGIEKAVPRWSEVAGWLRSVARRRNGDVPGALAELDHIVSPSTPVPEAQIDIARLRALWLGGSVDGVVDRLAEHHVAYVRRGYEFLARESGFEWASKLAWLGDADAARPLVERMAAILPDTPNVVSRVHELLARAAIAIAHGDEPTAAGLLSDEVNNGGAALDRPEGWYWRDRAAIALLFVLVPSTRAGWLTQPLGSAQRPGLALAEALVHARNGEIGALRQMSWPSAGVVRAHLPLRWIVELAAAARAAGNPPPDELVAAISPRLDATLHGLVTEQALPKLASLAQRWLTELPTTPAYRLGIDVLGRLRLHRDGHDTHAPELRRPRVRELLCLLVARRRARREAVAAELWPELPDPGPTLRVTLNHLQRALQPERTRGQPPFFLRATTTWLELIADERLTVDAWQLEHHLDQAEGADKRGAIADALEHYDHVVRGWTGEPYSDVPYAAWAETERARLRRRFTVGAIRAGELWFAGSDPDAARRAAETVLAADPASEAAIRLLARAHAAMGHASSARSVLTHGIAALRELGVEPDATTSALLSCLE